MIGSHDSPIFPVHNTSKKHISTNRPIKGIIDINQKLKKLMKVIISKKRKIISFKVIAKKIVCPKIANEVFISNSNYYLKCLITALIICN